MNYFIPVIDDDYRGGEKQTYLLHMVIAILSVPLYIAFDKFGILMMPYVFIITMRPQSCYLLPLIIHFSYGIQCRYAFCLACFLYVIFHINELVRYRLHWLYLLYLSIMPFFVWFTVTKFKDVQNYVSMSGNVSGLNTYLLFSCVFWGCIAIKKLGRMFIRHFVLWNLVLFAVVSLAGTEENRLFSRQIFYAIPLLGAVAVHCFSVKREGREKGLLPITIIGVLIYLLDFGGILRYKVTFTLLGLLILSCVYVYAGMKKKPVMIFLLNPKVLFVASFVVVMISATLVLKYRGMNGDRGNYGELSNTSIDSLITKLQMKAVDDRATLWALSIERIKDIWRTNPVFVDTVGRFSVDTDLLDGGLKSQIVTIEIPSHNVMLELLRSFGFYGGLGLYALYLCIFMSPRNIKILKVVKDPACLSICAVCVAQGIICGHTGQYVVQPDLGPINFVLLGACWRYLAMHKVNNIYLSML